MSEPTVDVRGHGCSCGDPRCGYDAHYGNPLRETAAPALPAADALAVMDHMLRLHEHTHRRGEAYERGRQARAFVVGVIAERDALLATLREYQDGRRISNLHTRQVAREIEQNALARTGGAK